MNIGHIPRELDIEIKSYIDESLNSIESFEYEILNYFDENELITLLQEDLPENDNKLSLIKDIYNISNDFFEKTKSKKIKIQLQVVTSDMCRLFHVDNNIQRLLCTYNGPGTEWLDEENLNRKALGLGDNETIVKDFSKIKRANEFDILLLKGKRFSTCTNGAVHRSPPINPTTPKRLLLKIDEL